MRTPALWWPGAGLGGCVRAQPRLRSVAPGRAAEPEQGALACMGASCPSPTLGAGRACRDRGCGPLLAFSGVWRVSGGWLLCVVSAVAPERSYVNICAEASGMGADFDSGLGLGEGGRGQQEGQHGGVRPGEPQPLFCPVVASRVVGLQGVQESPFTIKHLPRGCLKCLHLGTFSLGGERTFFFKKTFSKKKKKRHSLLITPPL